MVLRWFDGPFVRAPPEVLRERQRKTNHEGHGEHEGRGIFSPRRTQRTRRKEERLIG